MPIQDTIKILNDLIQTSEDRRKGFSCAARKVTETKLKILFQRNSVNCGTAVIELQRLVKSLGGTPKNGGTIVNAIHRNMGMVKTTIGNANIAVLEEVERGETQAKVAYTQALGTELLQQIRSVLQLQYYGAVRNYSLLRDLRSCHRTTKQSWMDSSPKINLPVS